ncbi:Rhodopsin domain-containing protein [Madurella fahalii]|uniref:Rhodopsin domain-containing protein n=1 Tax=Madurella fahalii TaxID=1157608 RepID=A0ABQ0GA71_9PEZI
MEGAPAQVWITERAAFLARVHVGVTIPLLALCLVPFFARIHVRVWPVWRFGLDDAFIVAGLLCSIVDWALYETELYFHAQWISFGEVIHAVILANFATPVWCTSMTLIKTSVALTLLRLPLKRVWTLALYLILATQGGYWLAHIVYMFAKCRPVHASWDFSVSNQHCPSEATDILVFSIGSGINILTDVALSIAPMFLFWNLRRPLRERILICTLTGAGLFASVASAQKAIAVARWTSMDDRWEKAMAIATWTITEQFVSVLAACSPSLKGPIQQLLGRCGVALVKSNAYLSFVHVPSRMREVEFRRQAREWLGEETMGADPAQSDLAAARAREADVEAPRDKSAFASTSCETSDMSGVRGADGEEV